MQFSRRHRHIIQLTTNTLRRKEEMKYEKGTFITVPNIEHLSGLSGLTTALFLWICKYSDDNGECFPSRAKLAKDMSCTVQTIDNHIKILLDKGLITKEVRKKSGTKQNMSNMYCVQIIGHVANETTLGSQLNDPTPSQPNDTVTKPIINQTHLTKISETVVSDKTDILITGQLPESRGKSYVNRVKSVYCDLFNNKYGFYPDINMGRFGKALKTLMETKTELQISAMMIVFFDWAGMTGDDNFTRQKLIDATHNFAWFFSTVNQYEVYLRNVYGLDLDNEEEVRKFVGRTLLQLK